MASDNDPHSKRSQKTVLGTAGSSLTPPPTPTIGGDDVADTFMSPGPRVTSPPEARPVTSPPEAKPPTAPPVGTPITAPPVGKPVTAPPVAAPPRSSTVLGASGAADAVTPGGSAPSLTAPEIGVDDLAGFAGLEDLPHTDPERLIGRVMADRYRILSLLGQGGMGVVYLAEHVIIEKKVALKVLNEELTNSRDVISRFIGEAKAASRIGHENIVDITDFGTTEDKGVFFVMEHLEGSDLSDRLKDSGRFSWKSLRDVAVQICHGLAAAHSKGIIHRDLKPENVFLISRGGSDDFVKILDFGIAKFTGLDGGEPKKTKTGVIFGTPDYMSPEQAEGKKADHRVDIYALGIILYELATGRLPFLAETFMGVLHQHMAKVPQPPRELVDEIPPDFEAVILHAMEKDPAQRYQSMNEFAQALEACTEGSGGRDGMAAPPMRPQSNISTGKVVALTDDSSAVSPTSQSVVELTASPAAAQPARKKSMVGLIVVIGLVTLGLAAGAFFFMKQRGERADRNAASSGGASAMTPPPAAMKPDATAPKAMAAVMTEPPMPVYVTPEKVTLSVKTTPQRVRADVYLDGKRLGKAPLKKISIPYSTQERTLEIRARRHKTVQIKFTPDANQSWERQLIRGKGTTRIVSMRPRPMDVMRPPPMDVMRPRPMDVMRPPPMDPAMRVAPMPPAMRIKIKGLKNPF